MDVRVIKAICVTLPSNVDWKDYEKELKAVENEQEVMNFKVPFFPKDKVDRCYIAHKGYIVGWMKVVGYSKEPFTCTTTGDSWEGKFIQRTGKFHYLHKKVGISRGFRGFKYIYVILDGTPDGKLTFNN